MTVKRVFLILGLLIVLMTGGLWYWQNQQRSAEQTTQQSDVNGQPDSVLAEFRPNSVIAAGVVVPEQWATLSFTVNGYVETWLHPEGASVTADTPLVRLRAPQLAQSVAQAEAALKVAQAQLADAERGARPEELTAAEAGVVQAEAQLEAAEAQLAQAEANVASAHGLQQQATAGVDAAQAQLQETERGPTQEEQRIATGRLKQAEAGVRQAQAAYDEVAYRGDITALPQSQALEEATQAFEVAQAEYDRIVNGATEEQLAQVRANERETQATLVQAEANIRAAEAARRQAEANARASQAAWDQAQAQLDMIRNGATLEELAVLQAQVQHAEAALQQARELESQMILTAPFDGILAHHMVNAGESVMPNQPVARFANLTHLQVETDDLDEIDAALVREGQRAEVTFDALPDVRVPGQVATIRSVSEEKRGETTFTVIVSLDESPEALRWGMTASVEIFVES